MKFEDYLTAINYYANDTSLDFWELANHFEHQLTIGNQDIVEFIPLRKQTLTPSDIDRVRCWLQTGYFINLPECDRESLFNIILDINGIRHKSSFLKAFEHYHSDHAIFKKEPSLFKQIRKNKRGKPDLELISFSQLKFLVRAEAVKYKHSYFKINHYLNPLLVNYYLNRYGTTNFYIRLNPHEAYSTLPQMKLQEEVLIKPNPKWIHNLSIYNGKNEGCSFYLDDNIYNTPPTQHELLKIQEYSFTSVRRLDVIAKRDGDGLLSMMLEELSVEEKANGYLIGRCIHLDTLDTFGASFKNAKLKHLDISINIYEGSKIEERMQCNLASGEKVTDASTRIHLLRVDSVKFTDMLVTAPLFFRSKYLTNEWIINQFT